MFTALRFTVNRWRPYYYRILSYNLEIPWTLTQGMKKIHGFLYFGFHISSDINMSSLRWRALSYNKFMLY